MSSIYSLYTTCSIRGCDVSSIKCSKSSNNLSIRKEMKEQSRREMKVEQGS